MPNAWLNHVEEFKDKNPGLSFKELLTQARKSYKGGNPVAYEPSSVASRSAKVGGNPVAYERFSVASRSAKFGGRKTRRKKSRRRR